MNKATYLITVFPIILILSFFMGCSGGNDNSSATAFRSYIDPGSSLEWASFSYNDYENYLLFDEVKTYCETLIANDKDDWRMPSADETLDYLIRNTEIYEYQGNYINFVTSQSQDLHNLLYTPVGSRAPGPDGYSHIIFGEIPYIDLYDDGRDYYYYATIYVGNNSGTTTDGATVYIPDETNTFENIYPSTIDDLNEFDSFTCVRGTHKAASMPIGTWKNIEKQVEIIGSGQYVYDLDIVDNRHIRLSTVMYTGGNLIIDRKANYISSGIPDARVKGLIKSFAEAAGTAPRASKSVDGTRAAVTGVAGIDVILGCIRSSEPEHCQEFIVTPATPDNPHNTFDQSSNDDLPGVLYVHQDADGNYILDNENPITIATGEITISLTDSAGNTAVFTVEVVGEDTDVGVLNIPDIDTLYNFKTNIDHGMDYIYHGYNDGETQIQYNKTLSICNIGAANISGTTFTIEVAPENASLVRSFTHDYNGASVGFTAGSCEDYYVSFEFNRPAEDQEVRFNITISDNFNSLTWKDYTTFRLSQYQPVDVHLASNTQPLEGYLIAPGNQLVRVQFQQYDNPQNFLRIPNYSGHEYSVVLATSSVDGEDTYMITTVNPPDRNKMNGFSDVTAYEPNDDAYDATVIPFLNGEIVSYLHSGDLDFYTIRDTSVTMRSSDNLFSVEDIIVPFNTLLNSSMKDVY